MKKYITDIKWLIILQVVFDALFSMTIAAIPYLQKLLFDNILDRGVKWVFVLAFLYLACVISGSIFIFISEKCSWKGAIRFEMSLKRDFFKAISRYSYQKFSAKDIGEYISIQGNDITALEQDYLTPLIAIIKSINMLIIYGIFLFFFVDWRIALTIFLASLIAVFVPKITSKTLSKRRNIYLQQMGRYVSRIKDFWEGFKLINSRTRGCIEYEHEKVLRKTADKRYHFGRFKVLTNIINSMVMDFVGVSSFIVVGILLLKGDITVGTGIATFGYIGAFIDPITNILYCINSINSLKDIKVKVLEYINYNEPITLISKRKFDSDIVFDQVSVHYDNFSLKDFSYKFAKGKKYALIGHSGSGKSTILNALMKYIKPETGDIRIDGIDIGTLDIANIICCINQHEHIFADNFMNNASVFSSYPTNKVTGIVKNLNLKQLDTIQNKQNCQQLSGGEKQILSIVRMLTADTPICLMDESLSAIDTNTTENIQNSLISIKDKTIIMVAHKLSKQQLEQFDETILMESGKILQIGAYSDILKERKFEKAQTIS